MCVVYVFIVCVCVHACTYMWMYGWMCVWMYECMYACMYAYQDVCILSYTCICVYTMMTFAFSHNLLLYLTPEAHGTPTDSLSGSACFKVQAELRKLGKMCVKALTKRAHTGSSPKLGSLLRSLLWLTSSLVDPNWDPNLGTEHTGIALHSSEHLRDVMPEVAISRQRIS